MSMFELICVGLLLLAVVNALYYIALGNLNSKPMDAYEEADINERIRQVNEEFNNRLHVANSKGK